MAKVEIQGIECTYRDLLPDEEVLYKDLPVEEQYFKPVAHPFTDDQLVDIANKEYQYTSLQKEWVDKQNWLFDNGCYAMIEGELTFLPGAYWCYINFWTLEHGEKPEYREDDRLFFIFHEYLRLETNCLGATRLKGRRQGATSAAMFFMWFIAGRQEHKLCGTTSYNDKIAQDNFQLMFMYGFKAMLPCFQADFDSDSENFVRFVKPVEKKRKGVLAIKREGLNSYVDYKSNAINSYDGGRQSYNCPDESAKRGVKVDINSYWSRLSKTLVVGVNKVGFAYLPTTVGQKKEGGETYKKLFKNSNQYDIDPNTGEPYGTNTPTRIVQFFMPASKCYAGCISKFGKSIEDDPVEPIMGNDGNSITEGARTKILRERSRLEGEQLMEHRRDYPLDVHDAFAFETGMCEFNEARIREQIEHIETNKEQYYLRRIRLVREETYKPVEGSSAQIRKLEIKYVDDPKGDWLLWEEPEEKNKFNLTANFVDPKNELAYTIGVDTFKDEFAFAGSKGTICVMKRSKIVDGIETGLYPVAMFVGRPRLLVHLYDEVLKSCLFYGCKANFELDAGTQYYNYFVERGAQTFLQWTPKIAIDPVKKGEKKIKPGTQSADPFALQAQLEYCKKYIDGDIPGGYNGHVHKIVFPDLLQQLIDYNHSERTPYDQVISLMMAILPMMGTYDLTAEVKYKPKSVLPKYAIKIPA